MSAFKITNARVINESSLIGAFDLEMPSGLKINGVMLMESHGKRWIGFPCNEWRAADGCKRYTRLIAFASPEVRDRFHALVLPLAEQALDPARS
jgi:hypothetical protein